MHLNVLPFFAVAALACVAIQAAPTYSIRTVDAGVSTRLVGIKDNGRTLGFKGESPHLESFTESRGVFTPVEVCDRSACTPYSIPFETNYYTQIVGERSPDDALFIYQDGATRFITTPAGGTNLEFNGLNDAGWALYTYTDANGDTQAFIDSGGAHWHVNLGLPGVRRVYGSDLDKRGDVLGIYYTTALAPHAFILSSHGTVTELNLPNATYTAPTHFSTNGSNVIGFYVDAKNRTFLYASLNGKTVLPSYPGSVAGSTSVNLVDNAGDVVGTYTDAKALAGHIYVYRNGKYATVPAPAGAFPAAINASGQIAGTYSREPCARGQPCRLYGFVATPVL